MWKMSSPHQQFVVGTLLFNTFFSNADSEIRPQLACSITFWVRKNRLELVLLWSIFWPYFSIENYAKWYMRWCWDRTKGVYYAAKKERRLEGTKFRSCLKLFHTFYTWAIYCRFSSTCQQMSLKIRLHLPLSVRDSRKLQCHHQVY